MKSQTWPELIHLFVPEFGLCLHCHRHTLEFKGSRAPETRLLTKFCLYSLIQPDALNSFPAWGWTSVTTGQLKIRWRWLGNQLVVIFLWWLFFQGKDTIYWLTNWSYPLRKKQVSSARWALLFHNVNGTIYQKSHTLSPQKSTAEQSSIWLLISQIKLVGLHCLHLFAL